MLPPDRDLDITNAMFAPFEESTFPCSLNNIQALQQLLNTPLAARCPIHPSQWQRFQSLGDSIFMEDATRTAPVLQAALTSAVLAHFPPSRGSELNYTSFWDVVGFGLPELAGRVLGFAVIKLRWVCKLSSWLCSHQAKVGLLDCSGALLQIDCHCQLLVSLGCDAAAGMSMTLASQWKTRSGTTC